jgi:hypothetical protein
MANETRDLIRKGKNSDVTLVYKDSFANITLERILTKENKISQKALKLFLFSNAMKKARDEMRKVIIKAIELGCVADGELQATLAVTEPCQELDKDKLSRFLYARGLSIEDFQKDGNRKKILTVA